MEVAQSESFLILCLRALLILVVSQTKYSADSETKLIENFFDSSIFYTAHNIPRKHQNNQKLRKFHITWI